MKAERGFLFYGDLAQVVEHDSEKVGVSGAIPEVATRIGKVAELADSTRPESGRRA